MNVKELRDALEGVNEEAEVLIVDLEGLILDFKKIEYKDSNEEKTNRKHCSRCLIYSA